MSSIWEEGVGGTKLVEGDIEGEVSANDYDFKVMW